MPAGVGIQSAEWPQPQQLDSKMGKVLRINTDGSVPRDNPFVGRPNAHPEIYALGLREDQGLDIHPRTGKIWASSNGVVVSSWSYRHSLGGLSGRQRLNVVPWRKRSPRRWS